MKLLLIIPVISGLVWAIFFSSLFTARHIECYTQFGACPTDLAIPLTKYRNHRLFSFMNSKVLLSDFKNTPQVVGVSVFRRLPSTLIFNLLLRRPLGAIGSSVLGAETIVDESGMAYASASGSALPLLITDSSGPVTPDQKRALQILNQLGETSSVRLIGELQAEKLVVNYPQSLNVIIDITKPIADWYPALHLILQRSKIDGKLPHKIDMRFQNPVVVF